MLLRNGDNGNRTAATGAAEVIVAEVVTAGEVVATILKTNGIGDEEIKYVLESELETALPILKAPPKLAASVARLPQFKTSIVVRKRLVLLCMC